MSTPRTYTFVDLNIAGSSISVPVAAPPKDPTEQLLYVFDFSQVLNRPIVQTDININGSPTLLVQIENPTITEEQVAILVSGGAVGDAALISLTVITTDNQIKVAALTIPIATIVTPFVITNSQLTINGYPVTWGGNSLDVVPFVTPIYPPIPSTDVIRLIFSGIL